MKMNGGLPLTGFLQIELQLHPLEVKKRVRTWRVAVRSKTVSTEGVWQELGTLPLCTSFILLSRTVLGGVLHKGEHEEARMPTERFSLMMSLIAKTMKGTYLYIDRRPAK